MSYSFSAIIDFPLPTSTPPAEVVARLAPWITPDLLQDPRALHAMLGKRWRKIRSKPLKQLAKHLLSFRHYSIVTWESWVWLRLRSGMPAAKELIGDYLYLPPPVTLDAHQRQLFDHGIDPQSVFAEFLIHFGGLREDLKVCGHFLRLGDTWEYLPDEYKHIEGRDDWERALVVYHARNGDCLLWRRDGKLAWWVLTEGLIRAQSDSFDDFLRYYVQYRQVPWPLDSYGP